MFYSSTTHTFLTINKAEHVKEKHYLNSIHENDFIMHWEANHLCIFQHQNIGGRKSEGKINSQAILCFSSLLDKTTDFSELPLVYWNVSNAQLRKAFIMLPTGKKVNYALKTIHFRVVFIQLFI